MVGSVSSCFSLISPAMSCPDNGRSCRHQVSQPCRESSPLFSSGAVAGASMGHRPGLLSRPGSICIRLMPVFTSPARNGVLNRQRRQRGSNDAWPKAAVGQQIGCAGAKNLAKGGDDDEVGLPVLQRCRTLRFCAAIWAGKRNAGSLCGNFDRRVAQLYRVPPVWLSGWR